MGARSPNGRRGNGAEVSCARRAADVVLPLIVLAVSLTLTAAAAWAVRSLSEARDRARFAETVGETRQEIEGRVRTHVSLLLGGVGLFAASEKVTRPEFTRYVEVLGLDRHYPGVRAIGYAKRLRVDEERRVVDEAREEAAGDYRIWPDPADDERVAVYYIEPRHARNLAALGFDMWSEEARREAMVRACDSGEPAASSLLRQMREIDPQAMRPGFALYAPVYAGAAVPATVEERRNRLMGFVYSPFPAGDFMASVLADNGGRPVGVRVFDGSEASEDHLLHAPPNDPGDAASHRAFARIDVAGRTWTLEFFTRPAFDRLSSGWIAPALLGAGIGASSVLFLLSRAQASASAAARRHASSLMRSEALLREAGARHRAVLDAAPDSIVTMDANGRIVDFNPAAERTFGFSRDDIVGRIVEETPVAGALCGLNSAQLTRDLDASGPAPSRVEQSGRRADGTDFPCEITVTPTRTEDGETFFAAYIRDITERKRSEEEIRRLTEHLEERVRLRTDQLRQANEEMEAFSYSVSHDLRAPLRHVQGFAERVIRRLGGALDEESRRDLETVKRSARQGAALMDGLLNLSRMARVEVKRVPLDMNALVEESRNRLQGAAPGREVEWKVARLPRVEGDPALVRVVLDNLLGNAVKFTRSAARPRIEVGARHDEERTVFYVRDNGAGFDPQHAERVFGVFHRLHSGEQYEGTGIGLATVRRIVQRHGGATWAEAREGEGATFFFSLPGGH